MQIPRQAHCYYISAGWDTSHAENSAAIDLNWEIKCNESVCVCLCSFFG